MPLISLLAVILPTLFNFVVDRFHGASWMYGVILSAFSFAQLFSNPLLGYCCDRFKNAKWVVIFGNLFELGGKVTSCDPFISV